MDRSVVDDSMPLARHKLLDQLNLNSCLPCVPPWTSVFDLSVHSDETARPTK